MLLAMHIIADEVFLNAWLLFHSIYAYIITMGLKNSLIIHEENTKKNHKRVVSVYVIQICPDLHKL